MENDFEKMHLFDIDLCGCCGKSAKDTKLKQCTGCTLVKYCSKECQRRDRKSHKELFDCGKTKEIAEENKILHEDLIHAQKNLTYAINPCGINFGDLQDEIYEHELERSYHLQPKDLHFSVSIILEEFYDKKLFKSFRGQVYWNSDCRMAGSCCYYMEGVPPQSSILISDGGEKTAVLTSRKFLEALTQATSGLYDDENYETIPGMLNRRNPNDNDKICRHHVFLEGIEVKQMKDGVVIITHCGS